MKPALKSLVITAIAVSAACAGASGAKAYKQTDLVSDIPASPL
jgi:hypothetical protein